MNKLDRQTNTERFAFKSYDYIKSIINDKDLIFDYDLTQMNKYSGRTIYDLINSGLDNTSNSIYSILFELNYIPKYIEQIMFSIDMYNMMSYNYKHLSRTNKYFKNSLNTYIFGIYLDKIRFEFANDSIQKILPKSDKDTYIKMEKHAIDLRNIYEDYIKKNYKEFKYFKFKYYYSPNGIVIKRKINHIKNYIKSWFDFYFNNGTKNKQYISNALKDCEKLYEESIKAIKDGLKTLNSDTIKNYMLTDDHVDNEVNFERTTTVLKSVSNLTNYCETSIIKLISVYNIMKHDRYRKFR